MGGGSWGPADSVGGCSGSPWSPGGAPAEPREAAHHRFREGHQKDGPEGTRPGADRAAGGTRSGELSLHPSGWMESDQKGYRIATRRWTMSWRVHQTTINTGGIQFQSLTADMHAMHGRGVSGAEALVMSLDWGARGAPIHDMT